VVVDPAGLDALLAESAAVPASLVRSAPAAAAVVPAAPVAALAELLASRLAPPAGPRPWLTLDEAAEYSGLPAAWLLSQARSGSLVAIDVGMGSQERWRFSRARLARLRRASGGSAGKPS
jgi:hypothetical protein